MTLSLFNTDVHAAPVYDAVRYDTGTSPFQPWANFRFTQAFYDGDELCLGLSGLIPIRRKPFTDEEALRLIEFAASRAPFEPLDTRDLVTHRVLNIEGRPLYVAEPEFFGVRIEAPNGFGLWCRVEAMSWSPDGSMPGFAARVKSQIRAFWGRVPS